MKNLQILRVLGIQAFNPELADIEINQAQGFTSHYERKGRSEDKGGHHWTRDHGAPHG